MTAVIILLYGALIGLFIFTVTLYDKHKKLSKRFNELENRVKNLNSGMFRTETAEEPLKEESPQPDPDTEPSSTEQYQDEPETAPDTTEKIPPAVAKEINKPPEKSTQKKKRKAKPKGKAAWVETFEKRFVENWYGIIGAVVLVIGLGILTIVGAVKWGPLFRLAMITGASLILMASSFFLSRKEYWKALGGWLRSAGAAVFLMACVGAAGISGLQIAQNLTQGLFLLLAGVALNIIMAFIGKKQHFASLHILLSLLAVSFTPLESPVLNTIPFVLGSIIALLGIAMTFKQKWEWHILLTMGSYLAYLSYFHFSGADLPTYLALPAAGLITAIGAAALLTHYRKSYNTEKLEIPPFLSHLGIWLFTGIALTLFAPPATWLAAPVFATALLVQILARRAKKIGIRWLYHTDNILSLCVAAISIVLLVRWDSALFTPDILLTAGAFISILFSAVTTLEKEKKMALLGMVLQTLTVLALVIYTAATPQLNSALAYISRGYLFLLVGAAGTAFILLQKRTGLLKVSSFKPGWTLIIQTAALLGGIALIVTSHIHGLPRRTAHWFYMGSAALLLLNRPPLPFKSKFPGTIELFLIQGAAYAAVLSFQWKNPQPEVIFGSLIALSIVFSALYSFRKLKVHRITAQGIASFLSAGFLIESLSSYSSMGPIEQKNRIILLTALAAGILINSLLQGKNQREMKAVSILDRHILDGLIPLYLLVITVLLKDILPWSGPVGALYLSAPLLAALIFLKNRTNRSGLGLGLMAAVAGLCLYSWISLTNGNGMPNIPRELISQIPFIILILLFIPMGHFKEWQKDLKAFGIYMFTLHSGILMLLLFKQISSLLPGVLWLLFSVLLWETGSIFNDIKKKNRWTEGRPSLHFRTAALLLIPAFIISHIVVDLQTHTLLFWVVKTRVITALFAAVIMLYYLISPRDKKLKEKFILNIRPLLLEITLAFLLLTLAVNIHREAWPLALSLISLTCLAAGIFFPARFSRLKWYGLILFWILCITLPILTFRYKGNPVDRFRTDWFLALVAFGVQFIFISLYYLRKGLRDLDFPHRFPRFTPWVKAVIRWKNLWIFYPVFISAALFCLWSFDRTILTICFFSEAFFIFLFSIILKENHFRHLSSAALLASLIRLVFFDLAQSNTILKAIIFIAVALIMILMNALYNRYKNRFMKKKGEMSHEN